MNRKQKTLTVAALIAFGMIINLHYTYRIYPAHGHWRAARVAYIEHLELPLITLAVLYVSIFFLLGHADRPDKRPRIQQKLGPPRFAKRKTWHEKLEEPLPPGVTLAPPRKYSPEELAALDAETAAKAAWRDEKLARFDAAQAAGERWDPYDDIPG